MSSPPSKRAKQDENPEEPQAAQSSSRRTQPKQDATIGDASPPPMDDAPVEALSSTPVQVVPIFCEGMGRELSRKWRKVDTSAVEGMKNLNVEVDEDEFGAVTTDSQDLVVELLKLASIFMLEIGGAIPLIVNNALDDDWKDQLNISVSRKLDANDNEDNSVSKLTEIFGDRKIRIFGNKKGWPPFVSNTAEGSVKWSLDESEFESDEKVPNIDKAELYIFILKVHLFPLYFLQKESLALELVGIIRVFIHETIHGMRMLKRLLDNQGVLIWSQNQYKDWCVLKSQFDKIVATPSRLGPAPKEGKASSDYPADAGRTWEHSITAGRAIFQEDCKVMVWVNDRFEFSRLETTEALEVLGNPRKLIEISRRHVDTIEARVGNKVERYITVSGIASTCEYQCPGSARWLLDHLDDYYAWRAESASANTKHGAEPVSGS